MGVYYAKYGTAWDLHGYQLVDRGTGQYKTSPTLASGDFKIEKDGGTAANLATLPSVEPAAGSSIVIPFSAAEMQCKQATVRMVDAAGAQWNDDCIHIFTVGDPSAYMQYDPFQPTVGLSAASLSAVVASTWGALRADNAIPGTFGESVAGVANGVHLDSEFHRGLAQAGSTTTVTLANTAVTTDDYYNNGILVILTGAGAGQARRITDYVGSTRVASFTDAFITAPDTTSTYTIYPDTLSNLGYVRGNQINNLVSGKIDASVLDTSSGQAIADEVLNRNLAGGGSGNSRNVRNALRSIRNRVRNNGGTLEVFEENDSTIAWSATLTTAAGNPITEVDP